jgi:hypothetical protein
MAKTNMVEREKRRAKVAKKYATKRAALKETIRNPKTGVEERQGAAARCQPDPQAQPLRDHWPLTRRVSQVRLVTHQAARGGDAWRHSRPEQGELVRGNP